MKKIFTIAFLLIGFLLCNQMKSEAMGLFYTNTTYPITATGGEVKDLDNLKKGSTSFINVLYFVEIGDASIDDAVKEAGITKISYIDVNEKSVFIFWRKVTVNVYGE